MINKLLKLSVSIVASFLVLGCATNPQNIARQHPNDPLEPLNRGIFSFNETLDENLLLPLSTAYRDNIPTPIQSGVRNFFGNLADASYGVNHLLQGDVEGGITSMMRVIFNSTLGIYGLFDISSEFGLEKKENDFGRTLGVWGFDMGSYLVLPVFGPSSIRDGIGKVIDIKMDILTYHIPVDERNTAIFTRGVSDRADLIGASKIFDEMAIDRYSQMRDIYMQRRERLLGKQKKVEDDE